MGCTTIEARNVKVLVYGQSLKGTTPTRPSPTPKIVPIAWTRTYPVEDGAGQANGPCRDGGIALPTLMESTRHKVARPRRVHLLAGNALLRSR